MVTYPNGMKLKEVKHSQKTNNNANRGMDLEDIINRSNQYYLRENKAVIYKKPTPIKVLHIINTKNGSTKIDNAHFLTPSTTDYNGVYRGKYLDFEAKETKNKTLFPLANIYLHQIQHLQNIVNHGGIGFLIICFTTLGQIYLIDQSLVSEYLNLGKSSIPYEVIKNKGHIIREGIILPLDYLKVVDAIYFSCEE